MKRNLRVAYILHRFPYLTETFIMREMSAMRMEEVDVTIFSLLAPKHKVVHEQAQELLPYTIYSSFLSWAVIWAQLHFLRRSPGRYLRALARAIWQVYREPGVLVRVLLLFPKCVYYAQRIEAQEIDHIHAHFVWLEGIAAGIAKDLLDISFSIHPHAFGLFARNQRDVRCELENATKIVTVSSYHRHYIDELCPAIRAEDVDIVHYGIDTGYFVPAAVPDDHEPLRILTVGRLHPKKGHEYLIDACALLTARGIPYQCQIVGSGDLRERLEARIRQHDLQDHVTLLGALAQDQIRTLYQASDIFALACVRARDGDQDGMPNVLIEAMACELPVVTTPLTGIPDLVTSGETGYLVAERDTATLADRLEQLLVDEELRQRLGKQARQRILDEFQIQHNAARLATIFKRVCESRSPNAGDAQGSLERRWQIQSTRAE